jgi:acetylornithine deacetylase
MLSRMDAVTLTRQLIDIESISGNEAAVADFLATQLAGVGLSVERMAVAEPRFNVYAHWPQEPAPALVFSTHMDTVPPFIASSEDDTRIFGRGACDAKGIIAAMVMASRGLHQEGIHTGLLFVVGEERDSHGAKVANHHARGSRFLVNGEPTGNRIALASKGALRVEITAHGKMAHSAYPEFGESAIDKLLDALQQLRSMPLPSNPEFGASTMNIGILEGGRAPNVIPDFAKAHLLYRLVAPSGELRHQIAAAASRQTQVDFVLDIPYMKFRAIPGIPTMTASFTTDIPALANWGEPVLLGPGSIQVAHTEGECIDKRELHEAVDLYMRVARELLRQARA